MLVSETFIKNTPPFQITVILELKIYFILIIILCFECIYLLVFSIFSVFLAHQLI